MIGVVTGGGSGTFGMTAGAAEVGGVETAVLCAVVVDTVVVDT